jgi:hypothetical protein
VSLPLLAIAEHVEPTHVSASAPPVVWKDVRKVSKQLIHELQRSGYVKWSIRQVLHLLVLYRLRTHAWPTPAELTRFAFQMNRIPREESRYIAPRLTELIRGWHITSPSGQRVRVGGGVCDQLPARRCTVTGQKAHPVAILEAGARARWVA